MEQAIGNADGNQPENRIGNNPGVALDPLGRPMNGLGADTSNRVQVPTMGDIQRARIILEELYRRAGERKRPTLELEYLERLLKLF